MRHAVSSSHTAGRRQRLSRRVRVRLPLATVEELDYLATLTHNSRQQLLRHIINAALISEQPLRPGGADPADRLRVHAKLTRIRSIELAQRSEHA
jgi:hypothetical protein